MIQDAQKNPDGNKMKTGKTDFCDEANERLTCMPQILRPRLLDVVVRHLFIWLCLFSSDASSPCCRVPILRSRIHGRSIFHVRFSSRMNSDDISGYGINFTWTVTKRPSLSDPTVLTSQVSRPFVSQFFKLILHRQYNQYNTFPAIPGIQVYDHS